MLAVHFYHTVSISRWLVVLVGQDWMLSEKVLSLSTAVTGQRSVPSMKHTRLTLYGHIKTAEHYGDWYIGH